MKFRTSERLKIGEVYFVKSSNKENLGTFFGNVRIIEENRTFVGCRVIKCLNNALSWPTGANLKLNKTLPHMKWLFTKIK
jgi:hypothetical protein